MIGSNLFLLEELLEEDSKRKNFTSRYSLSMRRFRIKDGNDIADRRSRI